MEPDPGARLLMWLEIWCYPCPAPSLSSSRPGACRIEVAGHLQEEQKADKVYTYKEGRGIDQFANAVAETFKKAGGQIRRVVMLEAL
jgi:hypothetical protein